MRLRIAARTTATPVASSIQTAPKGFLHGTRLLTPAGWCAVEELVAGDALTDRDGDAVRLLDTETIHVRGQGASVFRIAPDACGHGCPENPVFLPEAAALLVAGEGLADHFGMDEALVPVGALANGDDVARVALPAGLTWHHLTLARPAILIVDGMLLGAGSTVLPTLSPAEGRLLRLVL